MIEFDTTSNDRKEAVDKYSREETVELTGDKHSFDEAVELTGE